MLVALWLLTVLMFSSELMLFVASKLVLVKWLSEPLLLAAPWLSAALWLVAEPRLFDALKLLAAPLV